MLQYIWHIFQAGGIVMYPLIGFLILSWTIGIDRIKFYRDFSKELTNFSMQVDKSLSAEDSVAALKISFKNNETNSLCKMFYPTLSSARNNAVLENRIEENISYLDSGLKKGLHWLNMIVTMSPLLGLLGTVLGMISSFNALGDSAPTVITGGIGEALIATATGLVVAIIALAFHSYCANEVNGFIDRLEYQSGRIVEAFDRGQEQ